MQRHFPGHPLPELQAGCQAALAELAQAFPYQPAAPDAGLQRFTQVTPCLPCACCLMVQR
jgi:hypothetical protein